MALIDYCRNNKQQIVPKEEALERDVPAYVFGFESWLLSHGQGHGFISRVGHFFGAYRKLFAADYSLTYFCHVITPVTRSGDHPFQHGSQKTKDRENCQSF